MFGRDAFALDAVARGRGHVEQKVDEMVFEEIDFVDVQEASVGAREESRLESLDTLFERAAEINRPTHPVFGRAERKLDDGDAHALGLQLLTRRETR